MHCLPHANPDRISKLFDEHARIWIAGAEAASRPEEGALERGGALAEAGGLRMGSDHQASM